MVKITDVAADGLESRDRLAQSRDQMFERNISIMGERKSEVTVISSLHDDYVGFIAGLDEKFMQICLSDSGRYALINRDAIISVEQTGVSLESIEDERLRNYIERRIAHFARVAGRFTT